MSNLSNEMPFSKEPVNDEKSTPSHVMLFTLLLLIAGFILTGTMMLNYANAHRSDLAQTTLETETSAQADKPANSFFEKMGTNPRVADSENTKPNTDKGVMNQLFGGRSSSAGNWPKLKLTGFGSATDGNEGFAIINNHQYRQGDLIGGKVTLKEIRKHDVLVEYAGETKTLSMLN